MHANGEHLLYYVVVPINTILFYSELLVYLVQGFTCGQQA